MWKKLLVMGIALLGTFSVVYAFQSDLRATSTTYKAGGTITARIGELKKGDRVNLYTDGYSMQLIANNIDGTGLNTWFSMSTKIDDTTNVVYDRDGATDKSGNACKWTGGVSSGAMKMYSFECSQMREKADIANASLDIRDNAMIMDRITYQYVYVDDSTYPKNLVCPISTCYATQQLYENMKKLFVVNFREFKPGNILGGIPASDTKFSSNYITGDSWSSAGLWAVANSNKGITYTSIDKQSIDESANIRYSSYLKLDNVVFAASKGTASGMATVKSPEIKSDLYLSTGENMKIRFKDDKLISKFNQIENKYASKITQASKNSKVYLNIEANAGTSSDGENTVSALVYDVSGNILYYQPLAPAKGKSVYEFDTTNLPLGNYKIGVVNEVYNENLNSPSKSSPISLLFDLEIIEPLSDLVYTPSHTSFESDYYFSSDKGNVLASNKVASLSTRNGIGSASGENGIIFKLQPSTDSTHKDDYKSFAIPTESGSEKPILDSSNSKPYVIAKPESGAYLLPGVYEYRIQAYDANGDPVAYEASDTSKSNPYAQLNDGTIVKGISPSQGLITEDIITVVYPHESQITYEQSKDSNNQYYKKDNINESTFKSHLGTLTFASEANMQKLFDEGYTINTTSSKLMKKGSTTEQITALKIIADTSDKSKFYIDKNNDVEAGTYNFDAWLYFKNSKGDTALLILTDKSLYIAPSLKYINPDETTETLSGDTYTRKYNAYASSDNKENIFTLVSTDKSDLTSNSNVKYCVYDETAKTCAVSGDTDVLTLVDNGNGTAKITAKTYQKDDPDVIIRSYLEDDKGTILTYEDITIEIKRSERKMKWEGTKFSSLSSNVTAKEDGNFELKLPYDSANSIDYAYSKILKGATKPDDGILAIRHDEGTGALSQTMSGNLAAGESEDSFKLTGQCTGTSCYIEIAKAEDDIFEAGTARLYIVTEDLVAIEDGKISWNYQDASTWKVASSPLTMDYKEKGVVPVKIDTTKLPTDIKNVKITYTLEDTKKADTITVANKSGSTLEAEMGILQANQTTDNASIKAVISSDNYAQKTVTLPVKINKLSQSIDFDKAFKDLASSIKVDTSANYNYSAVIKVDDKTAGKGTISYTVAGTPSDMLTNTSSNTSYNVTKAGSVEVTATLTDDKNYNSTTKSVTKTITYYADAGLTWKQSTPEPEAVNTINGGTTGDADVNKEVGDIAIDGGKSAAYNFTVENTKHGDDSTYFSVVLNSDKKSGKLKIIKKIDATALNTHATQVGKGDTYEWTIKVKATSTTDSSEVAESEIKITFVGAQPDITFTKADSNKKITDTYGSSKNLDLSVKRGGVAASDPTITISGYSSALSLNVDGISALIKAANTDNTDAVRTGRKVEVKAQVPASGGYKTGDSPLNEVIIKKADHPVIDFDTKKLSSSNNVDVGISGILNGNGKSNETVSITPIKAESSDPWIIDAFSITKDEAYTTPSLPISPKGYLGTVDFTITATGDDNYKPLPDDTKTTIEFTEDGGIVYKPIVVTYGDKSKNVLEFIVTPNPKDDPDTVSYTYTGYDDTIISIDSDGKITPLKVGTTTLTFKRVDSADSSEMEQNIKVTVKPKDITIYVNSLDKKVGEVIKASDFTIDTSKSTAFEDGDDVGVLTYSCQDSNVEVTTLPNGLTGPAPKALPINVTHVGGIDAQKANYKITYKPGTLNVSQDTGLDSWVSVVPKGSTTFKNNWYNGDVDVKINAIAGSYSEISPDGNAPWSGFFTIIEEGKITQDVAFRDPTTLAKAKSITKEIKIDRHAPRVEKITAKSSNNKLEDILNALTFGTLFQPGTQFTINTSDKVMSRTIVNEVSGTSSLTYSIYRIEKDNSETELEKDKTVNVKDEAVGVKISDSSGTYKVCTTVTDLAGNKGTESCAKVVIGYKGMDETTGDNECPDLNLDFNDDGKAELNVDLDGDKIPDLNIDSDFDGEADINVDSDEDGKPDLNLVILDSWEPGMCSTINGKNYATMEGIKPEINIVLDNGETEIKNQIPSLNIDNAGDFKPHLNISKDGKTPYLNITKLHEWKPIHDYQKNSFLYDSIGTDEGEPFAETEIDSDDDGYPDLNIDTNKDGTPDLNIDSNYDGIPELNIDGDGDGNPDYNLEVNENGKPTKNVIIINKWEPNLNGNINGKEFDTMEIKTKNELEDNGVKVEKPGGTFLPNYAIKVSDAKDSISSEQKDKINAYVKSGNEIKDILDVKLYEGESIIQPDGTLKVRLPLKNTYKGDSIKVIVEQADGTFIQVDAKVEDGYLVYDTDYLGKVSIIGDKDTTDSGNTTNPDDPDTPKTPVNPTPGNGSSNTTQNPNTSVKGNYVNGTGGALTGDESNPSYFVGMMIISLLGCVYMFKKQEN